MIREEGSDRFLNRDSFLLGIGLGIGVPIAVYGILLTLFDFLEAQAWASQIGFAADFRERTLALIAICANLIPFHLYRKWHADNTMRGLVLPTITWVGVWFYLFGRHLVGL